MQFAQNDLKIKTWPQHISIHNLPLNEKDFLKSEQAGRLGSS